MNASHCDVMQGKFVSEFDARDVIELKERRVKHRRESLLVRSRI
jgi:hypothetical protein